MRNHRSTSTSSKSQSQGLDLFSIVYVSTAARQVPLSDLMHLLDGARRRNSEEGVTGLLLYSNMSFMQYLEGPAVGLARVYDVIKTHPLHYGLIDLVREPIEERQFPEWSMAFQVAGAFGMSSPVAQDALLASRLEDAARPKSVACDLLSRFWGQGRDSVSSALLRHSVARSQRWRSENRDTGTYD